MTPPILLIGKNGQLGNELARLLLPLGEVVVLNRQHLDLSRPQEICRVISEIRPTLIVNAAAHTAVDLAEKDEASARAINADAPAVMAEEAQKIGAGLVHYSTDYVFDGTKTSPYVESDPTNPLGVYGRTKLAGEQAVQATGAPHLIFRTAWVYGTRGRNFLLTMLRLATQREELRVVRDQIGAPTWSYEIAAATVKILQQLRRKDGSFDLSKASGLYHLTAAGEASWFEFASAIFEKSALLEKCPVKPEWFTAATSNLPLLVKRVIPITTAEYPTPASRPAYSVLSNAKLLHTFGAELLDWRDQLQSVFVDKS
jgi:dTDP-4-dehydrorhamnose reductase